MWPPLAASLMPWWGCNDPQEKATLWGIAPPFGDTLTQYDRPCIVPAASQGEQVTLAFGTSGLRGLVTALNPQAVAEWTGAFLSACPPKGPLFVGRDLRPSSPEIAAGVIRTARIAGYDVVDCGALPTPALALAAEGASAVMVTGSHIPADRNGLKFYTPAGEITKADEAAIQAAKAAGTMPPPRREGRLTAADALAAYAARYETAFGPAALAGLRIGVYQHSSVARDVLATILAQLGAKVVELARSDIFIPVDTEAVDPDTRAQLAGWCTEHRLDALVSTDGDADRPMVTDARGQVIPGDVLGVLTARVLGARIVVTPVSSNTMVSAGLFDAVVLTRIGSPFVVAEMEAALAADPQAKVVGFEANGGFLLGFAAPGPAGLLPPLMTRDSVLPILAPLAAAKAAGQSLAESVASLPQRFTAADRLKGIPTEASKAFIAQLTDDAAARDHFFADLGPLLKADTTDGLRLTFTSGKILHLRPSGNAPEFRVYAEADDRESAVTLMTTWLARIGTKLG